MGSENHEILRYLQLLDDAIKADEIEDLPKYKQTRGKIRKLPEETKEAEEEVKKMERAKQNRKNAEAPAAGSMDELRQMILAKKN